MRQEESFRLKLCIGEDSRKRVLDLFELAFGDIPRGVRRQRALTSYRAKGAKNSLLTHFHRATFLTGPINRPDQSHVTQAHFARRLRLMVLQNAFGEVVCLAGELAG